MSHYVYNEISELLLAEYDEEGKVLRSYVTDTDEYGELISVQLPDLSGQLKTYYYLYDGIGQIIGLVDETGKIVVKYSYDSWGVPKEYLENKTTGVWEEVPVGTFGNYYLYKGYYYDPETGLYYLTARYYDPTLGRFLTPDPDGGEQKDRLSLNPYIYVKNNPLNEDDPDGHNWWARAKKWAERKYKQIKKEVKKITKKIEKKVQKVVKKLTSKVSKAIKSVSKAIKSASKAVKKVVKSVAKQVTKAAKTLAKAYSSSPGGKVLSSAGKTISQGARTAGQTARIAFKKMNPDNAEYHRENIKKTENITKKYLGEFLRSKEGVDFAPKLAWGPNIHIGGHQYQGKKEGTNVWAQEIGFRATDAKVIAKADYGVDTSYYTLGGFWHFDWIPGPSDSRDVYAKYKMGQAKHYASEGNRRAALESLGQGLHGLQDKPPHGNLPGYPPLYLAQMRHVILSGPDFVLSNLGL